MEIRTLIKSAFIVLALVPVFVMASQAFDIVFQQSHFEDQSDTLTGNTCCVGQQLGNNHYGLLDGITAKFQMLENGSGGAVVNANLYTCDIQTNDISACAAVIQQNIPLDISSFTNGQVITNTWYIDNEVSFDPTKYYYVLFASSKDVKFYGSTSNRFGGGACGVIVQGGANKCGGLADLYFQVVGYKLPSGSTFVNVVKPRPFEHLPSAPLPATICVDYSATGATSNRWAIEGLMTRFQVPLATTTIDLIFSLNAPDATSTDQICKTINLTNGLWTITPTITDADSASAPIYQGATVSFNVGTCAGCLDSNPNGTVNATNTPISVSLNCQTDSPLYRLSSSTQAGSICINGKTFVDALLGPISRVLAAFADRYNSASATEAGTDLASSTAFVIAPILGISNLFHDSPFGTLITICFVISITLFVIAIVRKIILLVTFR